MRLAPFSFCIQPGGGVRWGGEEKAGIRSSRRLGLQLAPCGFREHVSCSRAGTPSGGWDVAVTRDAPSNVEARNPAVCPPCARWRTPGPLHVWGQTEHSNASRSQCLLPVSSDTLRTSRRTLSRDGLGERRQAILTATYPPGVRTWTPSSPSSETWFLVWELKKQNKTKHFSSQHLTS